MVQNYQEENVAKMFRLCTWQSYMRLSFTIISAQLFSYKFKLTSNLFIQTTHLSESRLKTFRNQGEQLRGGKCCKNVQVMHLTKSWCRLKIWVGGCTFFPNVPRPPYLSHLCHTYVTLKCANVQKYYICLKSTPKKLKFTLSTLHSFLMCPVHLICHTCVTHMSRKNVQK